MSGQFPVAQELGLSAFSRSAFPLYLATVSRIASKFYGEQLVDELARIILKHFMAMFARWRERYAT